jgi:hypothetical protein
MGFKKLGLFMLLMFLVVSCKEEEKECPTQPTPPTASELLQNSLHGTTNGMAYWYSAQNGGFENISNIPYDNLGCQGCHIEPDACNTCHVIEGDVPIDNACLGCHGRQNAEISLGYTDVHRDMGFPCAKCHNEEDAHGDGNMYNSMLEGAIHINCYDCHADSLPSNSAHNQHLGALGNPDDDELDCSACHVKTVVTCYNCHFESLVNEGQKVAYSKFHGWKILVKRNGKVHAGNLMTVVYQGKAFVAIAPFYGHTIYKPDPSTICDECHSNAIVQEYNTNGTMTAVWWDSDSSKLEYFEGTIPLPSDWQSSLRLSFVTKDTSGNWIHLKDEADLKQILFAEPLDKLPPQF